MNSYLTTRILAGAGLILGGPSLHAAAVVYTDGDLLLGFRATGGQGALQTYLINIGQASMFRDQPVGSTSPLAAGSIGADLTSIYGANWHTRADLFWGVAGGIAETRLNDPANTLYASADSPAGSTLASAWARRSNSAQSSTLSQVQGAVSGYLNDPEGSNNNSNTFAVRQNTTDNNNWSLYQPGGNRTQSFNTWNPTIEGNFDGGAAVSELDLFRIVRTGINDGSGATTGESNYEGTFAISPAGLVSYTVVPEPSVAVMLAAAAGLLGVRRRRSTSSATY